MPKTVTKAGNGTQRKITFLVMVIMVAKWYRMSPAFPVQSPVQSLKKNIQ
jgi:hypothetical protein